MKLLFATDFSKESREALANLKQFKHIYHPTIYILHVISSFYQIWFGSRAYLQESEERLKHWQQMLGEDDSQRRIIEKGNVPDHIIGRAKSIDADLIMLGGKTENKGRYHSAEAIGSVARYSHQSVWIAKSQQIKKILCCVDGSHHSAKTLEKAAEFAHDFNAELNLIHVLARPDFNPLGLEDEEIKRLEQQFKDQQQQEIDDFIDKQLKQQLRHTRYYHWGQPSHVILNMAEDEQYDLIIIGAKGHSQLYHVFIGSTTERVLRHTPCSLAIIK